jgi:hypothetical protein
VKRALTLLENHHVIERIEGRFNQNSCQFAVLPTILTAVSSDRLSAIGSPDPRYDCRHTFIGFNSMSQWR